MNIHVVCRDLKGDRILPRLARQLVSATGWSVSNKPDPRADLNYYAIYLDWEATGAFTGTPTAAWFTHREEAMPAKTAMWDRAAAGLTLRLTSAQQYADILVPYGPTEIVTPPLDLDKFRIAPKPLRPRPVIGVSGFVYKTGRKGEDLLSQFLEHPLGKKIELVATGEGWPVRIKYHTWADMERFYQGLDIYLCTATIEGVPYPPLEALACGVPVIIPIGVGLLDDLPDIPGIHRYKAGDFEDMTRAIEECALSPVLPDREALRGAVEGFTEDRWIKDHLEAFEPFLPGYLLPPPGPSKLPDQCGVYLVAFGDPARDCARRCIASLKAQMPGLPVALASSEPLGGEDVFIAHSDDDLGARSVKTQIYELAPKEWRYVLYLDADTEVTANISFLFQVLIDGWEMACCINPAQYILAGAMRRPDNGEECNQTFTLYGTDNFVQLNGGVFSFRRCASTQKFFELWHAAWQEWGKRDQAAMDRALWHHPLKLYVLGSEWNTVTRYIDPARTAGILHYPLQARRWRGVVKGRLDSKEAWAALHPTRHDVQKL